MRPDRVSLIHLVLYNRADKSNRLGKWTEVVRWFCEQLLPVNRVSSGHNVYDLITYLEFVSLQMRRQRTTHVVGELQFMEFLEVHAGNYADCR
jgi:hypothetical protein